MDKESDEQFLERFESIKEECGSDREEAHRRMDALLCDALREYGEDELVEAFESYTKWYC